MAAYATYLSNAVGFFDYSIPYKTGANTFNSENWLKNTKCQGWLCLIVVIICMIILHGLILLSDLWLLFCAEEDTQNRFKNDTSVLIKYLEWIYMVHYTQYCNRL